MVANVLTPALRKEKQADLLESEASKAYVSTAQSCHVVWQGFYVSYRAKILTVAYTQVSYRSSLKPLLRTHVHDMLSIRACLDSLCLDPTTPCQGWRRQRPGPLGSQAFCSLQA